MPTLPALNSQKLTVQELTSIRKPLLAQFLNNPRDTHLALELKIIDDQIAEHAEQLYVRKKKQSK